MNQLSPSQANLPLRINENFNAVAASSIYGYNPQTSTGLTFGYFGAGPGGAIPSPRWGGFNIADGTLSLAASATNYVVVALATGILSTSTATTNWADSVNYAHVYKIVTGAASITTIEDHRAGAGGALGGGGGGSSAGVGTWKNVVRAATTAAVTLSGIGPGTAMDGVTLATGDAFLNKDAASPAENGIYVVQASGSPVRRSDATLGAQLVDALVPVSEGTVNADKVWICSTNAPITVGTTGLTFAAFGVSSAFGGGTLSSALNEAPPVTIASASTMNIGAAAANTINVTGTTAVTAFDTIAAGARRVLVFAGILTLTHNATSFQNITGANITTAVGDVAEFESLGAGNWKMIDYTRQNGSSLVVSSFSGGTLSSALNEATPVTLASASTVNIGAAAANSISVSGTTAITAFDTIAAGARRELTFAAALTLTHNATSLQNIGSANIVTTAGDVALFVSLGGGNWKMESYSRNSGVSNNEQPPVTVASAATTNIGVAQSRDVVVSGTTTITAFDTIPAGITKIVRFSGILTLTYNATSLILPTSANITTAVDDVAEFLSLGGGNWFCKSYSRKAGTALASSGGGGGGLTNITETLQTASPNATINAEVLAVSGGSTNTDLVLTAKGTGAYILGPYPDGTTTGGNKRGTGAFDGIQARTAAGQVVGQNYGFAWGTNHQVGGVGSSGVGSVAFGTTHTIPATSSYNLVVGDTNVVQTGSRNTVGGGNNTATGSYLMVAGYNINISSTCNYGAFFGRNHNIGGSCDYLAVFGYIHSINSGAYQLVAGFQHTMTAAGDANAVFGYQNTVANSGAYGLMSGTTNRMDANYGLVTGNSATMRASIGMQAHATIRNSVLGDRNTRRNALPGATSNATPRSLTADFGAPAATNQFNFPAAQCAMHVVFRVVGYDKTNDVAGAWRVEGCVKRNASGTVSVVGTPVVTALGVDTGTSAWGAPALVADNTNKCASIQVTGGTGLTIDWNTWCQSAEVA